MMVIKGVMRTISILQEKKQRKLLEKQKQQEETREQIRLEERNKLGAIESSWYMLYMGEITLSTITVWFEQINAFQSTKMFIDALMP